MIKVENLSKKFGETYFLFDVSFNVEMGDKLLISGENGAGKSTLFRAILGEYQIFEGNILINGENITKDRKKTLKNIAFVPQIPPPLELTLNELVEFTAKTANLDKAKLKNYCEKLAFDLEANKNKPFYKLSGGMKQKFLISIALARDVELFIFDEPTASLDVKARESFYKIFKSDFMDKTALFISHKSEELVNITNARLNLDLGKVISYEKNS